MVYINRRILINPDHQPVLPGNAFIGESTISKPSFSKRWVPHLKTAIYFGLLWFLSNEHAIRREAEIHSKVSFPVAISMGWSFIFSHVAVVGIYNTFPLSPIFRCPQWISKPSEFPLLHNDKRPSHTPFSCKPPRSAHPMISHLSALKFCCKGLALTGIKEGR